MATSKKKKFNMVAVAAAVGSGAAFNVVLTKAAAMNNRDNFVNNNFGEVKAVGALVVGSALEYFGKQEWQKAAGYGILGLAGESISNKIMFAMSSNDTAEDGQVNGLRSIQRVTHQGLKAKQLMNIKRAMKMRGSAQPSMRSAQPTMRVMPKAQVHDVPAFGSFNQLALASACGL